MSLGTILLLLIIGFIVIIFMLPKEVVEQKLKKNIKRIRDFDATQKILKENESKGILIDSNRHKVALIHGANNIKIYGFKDILGVELIEDGKSLMKTSTSSVAGRAIVGGLFLGPLGAVVGGVTGKKSEEERVMEISLNILLNDTQNSIYSYTFLKKSNGVKKDSLEYKQAMEKAKKWHANIKVVINRAEDGDTQLNKSGGSFNATFETDKIDYLQNKIGTREKLHQIIASHNFNKKEKDILIQVSVAIKKENVNEDLVEQAYKLLSGNHSKNSLPSAKDSLKKDMPKVADNEQTTDSQKIHEEQTISFSFADEIKKLKSLKDDGIISEEEFLKQKNKLLNQ